MHASALQEQAVNADSDRNHRNEDNVSVTTQKSKHLVPIHTQNTGATSPSEVQSPIKGSRRP
jgi:hypothetical protein